MIRSNLRDGQNRTWPMRFGVVIAISYLFDDFPFNEVNNKHAIL